MQLLDAWGGCVFFCATMSSTCGLTSGTHASDSASHASTASSRPAASSTSMHPLLHFRQCHESTYLPPLALLATWSGAVGHHSPPGPPSLWHLPRSRQRNEKAHWRDLSEGILRTANAGSSMSFTQAWGAHAGHVLLTVSVMP